MNRRPQQRSPEEFIQAQYDAFLGGINTLGPEPLPQFDAGLLQRRGYTPIVLANGGVADVLGHTPVQRDDLLIAGPPE